METSLKSGRPFPEHVTDVLESFYKRGMTGWSGDRTAIFQEALESTPLDDAQLKVYIILFMVILY